MPIHVRVPAEDVKRQPGAYLTLGGKLYEVIGYEVTGLRSGRLHVLNSLTLHPLWLTDSEVDRSKLVPRLATG